MTEPTTHTLNVPGAVLHYDIREPAGGDSSEPALLLIGSPMGAAGFVTLAGHFPDRRVVTYDPRGAERSVRTDDATEITVEEHVDDLHRVIGAVGGGPVDVFASSGGAVNALALVATHPEDVRTLVAHEPPASSMLPDRDAALAACENMVETYAKDGLGPAMVKFISIVSHVGPIPDDFGNSPFPDPAQFGLPTEDDGSRNDALMLNMISCNAYEHDAAALRAASTNVILAVGADGEGTLARRGGEAIAAAMGTEPVVFPGDHGGFLGGEYGQTGRPDEFGAKLRDVLATGA